MYEPGSVGNVSLTSPALAVFITEYVRLISASSGLILASIVSPTTYFVFKSFTYVALNVTSSTATFDSFPLHPKNL